MATYYVIDKRSNTIVNAVETQRPGGPSRLGWDIPDEYLEITARPTQKQLEGYRYWNERP